MSEKSFITVLEELRDKYVREIKVLKLKVETMDDLIEEFLGNVAKEAELIEEVDVPKRKKSLREIVTEIIDKDQTKIWTSGEVTDEAIRLGYFDLSEDPRWRIQIALNGIMRSSNKLEYTKGISPISLKRANLYKFCDALKENDNLDSDEMYEEPIVVFNWDEQPFGAVTDISIAKKLGVSREAVRCQRAKRGIPVYKKNPAAVALGRLGGKKGGPARAEKLSPERRSEIAQKAAEARWGDK